MTSETKEMIAAEELVTVPAILEALVPRFLDNRRLDVTALQGALSDEDFTTVQSIGHAMKGTGGGYGFHAISAIGRDVEEAAKVEDAISIQQLVEALEAYLDRVKIKYA